jgi:hypothetical protein
MLRALNIPFEKLNRHRPDPERELYQTELHSDNPLWRRAGAIEAHT